MSAGLRCFADCRGLSLLGFRRGPRRLAGSFWARLPPASPGACFADGASIPPFYNPGRVGVPTRRTLRKGVASSEGLHELRLGALPGEPLSNGSDEPRSSSLREGWGLGEGQESLWPFRFCEQAGVLDFGVKEGQDLALLLRSSRGTWRMPQTQNGPIQLPEPHTRSAHASSRLRLLALVTSPPCGSAEGLAPYGA
jgi:hypothetical protein